MSGTRKIILSAVAVLSLMTATPAFADNGHGKDKNKNAYEAQNKHNKSNNDDRYDRNNSRTSTVKIYDTDRTVLKHYVEDTYKKSCPPGLAKKHNGCTPPGQAKRRYIVGYPLPSNVTYYMVPHEVRSHLRPVPEGYQYVRVDDDVLLMNSTTKHIIDAVTLLSAIGK